VTGLDAHSCRHAELVSVSVFGEEVQILKQVQDDGVGSRMMGLIAI
jgi:hypothetical protein